MSLPQLVSNVTLLLPLTVLDSVLILSINLFGRIDFRFKNISFGRIDLDFISMKMFLITTFRVFCIIIYLSLPLLTWEFTAVPSNRQESTSRPPPKSIRNIVVVSRNVSPNVVLGLFDDRNLLHNRIDVLSRCVTSSLFISNRLRQDTSLFLMLFGSDSDEGTTIEISGENVRELNPDERTAALCIQRALLSNSHARVAASER